MATDKDLLGVWELQAWELQKKSGEFVPRGKNVRGLLMYSPIGRMSVSITSDGPKVFYAGTFEVKGDEVLHGAEITFDEKNFSNVRRRIELDGDTLVLRTPIEDAVQVRLTWKRIGGPPA